jgi:hypothetical protein
VDKSIDSHPFTTEVSRLLVICMIFVMQCAILSFSLRRLWWRIISKDSSISVIVTFENPIDIVTNQYCKNEVDFLNDKVDATCNVFWLEKPIVLDAA